MIHTYDDLKQYYNNWTAPFRNVYNNFFEIFEALYDAQEIKYVYIKNLFNSNEVQTFFFFQDKTVKISKSDIYFNFEEIKYQVVKKHLTTSRNFERDVQLKLTLDDASELIFHNLEDSNPDWAWDYGQDIKELFINL